jgi:leucyl aminopeptidase
MSDDEGKYSGVLEALRAITIAWQEYQRQLSSDIAEHKKTVNNAILILANEAAKQQSDTTKRLEDDATERRARQLTVDTATVQVRNEMLAARAETRQLLDTSAATVKNEMLAARAETLARLDETNVHSVAHERRAGRERIGLAMGMGCLLVILIVTLIVMSALLVSLYWKPA